MARRKALIYSIFLLAGAAALADSVTGKDRILCSAVETIVCTGDGVCDAGPPWDWQIPQFLIVDLKSKSLETTAASGENRSTPILALSRDDGQIMLQGVQNQRAFSLVLHEETGRATFAIATDGVTVNVFGACTALPVK